MYRGSFLSANLLLLLTSVKAASILFQGGIIIAFDKASEELRVIRNGSLLVQNDRIVQVSDAGSMKAASSISNQTQVIDVTGKIITPGFIDTHRHGWQTAFKTIASNTSLVEYFGRYGEFVAGDFWTADDVYNSQLAGLYDSVNGGVTTTLDHAHHTWSNATAEAGLKASIDSGARVFWSYAFHNVTNYTVEDQLPNFRDIASRGDYKNSPTTIGVAYDFFGPAPNVNEVNAVIGLAKEFNVSVITTHSLQGPWGITNSPEDFESLGILNMSTPIVFSHASFLTAQGASLLRSTTQHISTTPESEMHYGHTHPKSFYIQDQSAIGIDTHFTYSSDILTQARIWLQQTRYELYSDVLERWRVPPNNPMSVYQAFLMATRKGGLALRRDDLGVIAEGAKADLVVWDGDSPSLLGWVDPVAAVILHASVGDIEAVLVDGKWVKRDGKIAVQGYEEVKRKFLETAKRIQEIWRNLPLPDPGQTFNGGFPIEKAEQVDVLRGPGDGYGNVFV